MPDICMCLGKECPKKEHCYRYRAYPSMLQSFFTISPYKNDTCEYFWNFSGDEKRIVRKMEDIKEDFHQKDQLDDQI